MKAKTFFLLFLILTACNEISIRTEIKTWQTQTDLIVKIADARPNVQLKIIVSNMPRVANKEKMVTTDADGNAEVTFEYAFNRNHPGLCDLNTNERKQKGVVVARDESNPNSDEVVSKAVTFNVRQFYPTPVGGNCPE